MNQVRAKVRFKGRVQGVGFRAFTERTAATLGLTGWVRNLGSGEVEAVFEGRETQIRRALDACLQGPVAAEVTELLIDWEECTHEFSGFSNRH